LPDNGFLLRPKLVESKKPIQMWLCLAVTFIAVHFYSGWPADGVLKGETCGWCYEQKGLLCNKAVLTECKSNFY
jgi:hypothetical protein